VLQSTILAQKDINLEPRKEERAKSGGEKPQRKKTNSVKQKARQSAACGFIRRLHLDDVGRTIYV